MGGWSSQGYGSSGSNTGFGIVGGAAVSSGVASNGNTGNGRRVDRESVLGHTYCKTPNLTVLSAATVKSVDPPPIGAS